MSEIMTIIIAFHTSNQRDFKNYYTGPDPRLIIKTVLVVAYNYQY